ncbi:hypothetical protein [Candidatus Nitrospira nitrosa]|uniref:hypothetical protein n=1 Tax=Candidatus Nitrospira nitrosa TaxID=1742972 RepID=UPI000B312390|nr:hypothetical protein [Candidatus Nitrospira nitrosa]
MLPTIMKRVKGRYWVVAVAIGIGVASATGCATESLKPAPTMTPEQVKSNADKSFERLKQEEKNRAVGSEAVSY